MNEMKRSERKFVELRAHSALSKTDNEHNVEQRSSVDNRNILPSSLQEKRHRESIGFDVPSNTTTCEGIPLLFQQLGIGDSFDLEKFKQRFSINIIKLSKEEAVFELIGIDAALANAFRRIMIAEVPTMAIEDVYIMNNTSVIQDEVLAHRIGLIPIKVDPSYFEFRTKENSAQLSDKNTITFKLNITCTRDSLSNENTPKEERFLNSKVYSRDLKWIPEGNQAELFKDCPIAPVYDNILIAKLRPGQSIQLEAHCSKGIGQVHAKWSPVSTASYRLAPAITLLQKIVNQEAEELVKICPMNVFDLEDFGNGEKRAKVSNEKRCTMCRECIRDPKWRQKVKLAREKDHFIFSVESVGIIPASQIFTEAIRILIQKCETIEEELRNLTLSSADDLQ